jgi:uncharacterized protein (TIGR02118 family)
MAIAKLTVIYPQPADVEVFEKHYKEERVPKAVKNFAGKTKIVATKVVAAPQGKPAFYRIAEIYFPSRAALDESLGTAGAQETAAHAVSISSGGPPIFLIAEEETFEF